MTITLNHEVKNSAIPLAQKIAEKTIYTEKNPCKVHLKISSKSKFSKDTLQDQNRDPHDTFGEQK